MNAQTIELMRKLDLIIYPGKDGELWLTSPEKMNNVGSDGEPDVYAVLQPRDIWYNVVIISDPMPVTANPFSAMRSSLDAAISYVIEVCFNTYEVSPVNRYDESVCSTWSFDWCVESIISGGVIAQFTDGDMAQKFAEMMSDDSSR